MLALLLVGALPSAGRAQQRLAAALVFDGVTVVDVEQGTLQVAQRVVLAGNRIQTVGPADRIQVPAGARVVAAQGKYLIPGLWDMHTHWGGDYYPRLIAAGVTGIRVPGGPTIDSLLHWRREISAGTRVGPRQIIGGPMLGAKPKVPTPADARRLVDSIKQAGADVIKIHGRGISREIYFALAAAARRQGIPFGGHTEAVTALEASDSGASIIDHSHTGGGSVTGAVACLMRTLSATAEECRPVAEGLRRNGTWWVPTLVAYHDLGRDLLGTVFVASHSGIAQQTHTQRMKEWWADSSGLKSSSWLAPLASSVTASSDGPGLLSLARETGVPTLAGTDTFGDPGFDLHLELAMYVAEGLTPLEALQTATLNPAKYLRGTDSLGTVAVGKLADLVLLDANPLADISNTLAIRAVVANGRYFDRPALEAMVAEVRAKAAQKRAKPKAKPKPRDP